MFSVAIITNWHQKNHLIVNQLKRIYLFLFCSSGGLGSTKEDLDGFQVQNGQ